MPCIKGTKRLRYMRPVSACCQAFLQQYRNGQVGADRIKHKIRLHAADFSITMTKTPLSSEKLLFTVDGN
ncbi:hypothetical protein STEG23_006535 [Scotinomys teguina]